MHTVVIGGRRGLGKALVRFWLEKGYIVSVLGRTALSESHQNLFFYPADLTDIKQTNMAIDLSVGNAGAIDALVFSQRNRDKTVSRDYEWTLLFEGMVELLENLSQGSYLRNQASVVLINSIAHRYVALSESAAYHAAKAAVRQIVRYYAVKFGIKAQVRVNSVSPAVFLKEENRDYYSDNAVVDRLIKGIPLGRIPTDEDIAYLIDFLSSKRALSITGQDFLIDGGMSHVAPGTTL